MSSTDEWKASFFRAKNRALWSSSIIVGSPAAKTMPGTLPELRRRRLAPVPCSLRSKATNSMTAPCWESGPPATRPAPVEEAHPGRTPWCAGETDQKLLFCSEKREVTDAPSEMRRMVSAHRQATDSWRIFEQALAASVSGMVLVMTTSSSCEPAMRSMAGPDRIGCVQYAKTLLAPRAFSTSAA